MSLSANIIEIIEKKISHARSVAEEFERMGMSDSAETWRTVQGVLEGIFYEMGE
jgi:hypothetical protein